MATANNPFGFLPLTSMSGATGNFEEIYVPILYSDTTPMYTGDPVVRTAAGYAAQWVAAQNVGNLLGIFNGCHYLSTSQGQVIWNQYWPGADVASGAQGSLYAKILPINSAGPSLWIVQSDSTGVALADIGQNVDVALGTGSAINGGRSGAYINMSTKGTTNTLPFRIVNVYASPSMGAFGAFGVSGITPGTTTAGVANPYGGGPAFGTAGAAVPYNWAIVQANITSTGTGI